MKTCTTCGVVKWLDDFPPNPKTLDRHRGECSECYRRKTRRLTREWAARNPDRRQARNKAVAPAKLAANQAVKTALQSGRLVRPETCEDCGRGGRIEAHHEDYDKPLDVIWLCTSCHAAHERRNQRRHAA